MDAYYSIDCIYQSCLAIVLLTVSRKTKTVAMNIHIVNFCALSIDGLLGVELLCQSGFVCFCFFQILILSSCPPKVFTSIPIKGGSTRFLTFLTTLVISSSSQFYQSDE